VIQERNCVTESDLFAQADGGMKQMKSFTTDRFCEDLVRADMKKILASFMKS